MADTAQPWWWRFHLGQASAYGVGVFDVSRGPGVAARLLCFLLRLPRSATEVVTTVAVTRGSTTTGGVTERWVREFAGQRLVTTQIRHGQHTEERVGPVALSLRLNPGLSGLAVRGDGCWLRLGRWRWPLPPWISPRITGEVWADEHLAGRFHVLIRLEAPRLGQLVRYGGYLDEKP